MIAEANRKNVNATGVAFRTRPKRPKDETTDGEYVALLDRLIKRYAGRIERSGPDALAQAVRLRAVLDAVVDAGVEYCLGEYWQASWAEIAEATGLTRQGAMRRWGRFEQTRRRGSQPSNLR